mgnify:CR=1 FL=1
MLLDEIRPLKHYRVMDLVAEAGVDVSDWDNFKGGAANAAANPKYCYEWAFVEPGIVAVLNIWFEKMQVSDGEIFQELNLRKDSLETSNPVWRRRAQRFDSAVQNAWRHKLPLRVIVCDGMSREGTGAKVEASRVQNRLLDPEPWSVTEYDWMSGACRISRGKTAVVNASADASEPVEPLIDEETGAKEPPLPFVDQFSAEEQGEGLSKRRVESEVFARSAEVRCLVLKRAGGSCEYCGVEGFRTAAGSIYLETHHVVPLSENGSDTVNNVVAICPNHHREAHYGEQRDTVRTELLSHLATQGDR